MKKLTQFESRCSYISERSNRIICVHRRNGYIAIDEYNANYDFLGPMFVGSYHECDVYLQALLDAYYRKMF